MDANSHDRAAKSVDACLKTFQRQGLNLQEGAYAATMLLVSILTQTMTTRPKAIEMVFSVWDAIDAAARAANGAH